MKKIVLTGGGTSGHVTPNVALLPGLKQAGYMIHYIGSKRGIEKQLIEKEGIQYHSISSGKLRRYFDLKNVTDIFRVLSGLVQAFMLLGRLKPDVVFSKGGYVSCPVVWAAWLRGIPAVIHESDITPGLTNKLSFPFAKKICYTFPESEKYIPKEKGVRTGLPIREGLLKGNSRKGREICGFDDKPVVLVIGGSLGSEKINNAVRNALKTLLKSYNICHICGNGNLMPELGDIPGYRQFEYVNDEQPHFFALSSLVLSRAGATILFELLALKKPNLLIPLTKTASRGDQILNALSFEKQGFSMVMPEEKLNEESLVQALKDLHYKGRTHYEAMNKYSGIGGSAAVLKVIRDLTTI